MGLFTSLIGGALSIFGAKSGAKQQQANNVSNAVNKGVYARQAAEKSGFNPLTMLENGGGYMPAAGNWASQPVLASLAAIGDGVEGYFQPEKAVEDDEKAQKTAKSDIEKINAERASAGGVAGGIAAKTHAAGTAKITLPSTNSDKPPEGQFTMPNMIAPKREKDVIKLANSPGVFELQNRLTGNRPITIPGDSEPWGIDELATAAIVGGPQVVYHVAKDHIKEGLDTRWSEGWENDKKAVAGVIKPMAKIGATMRGKAPVVSPHASKYLKRYAN